jgi:heterodisulfide reductase subunit A-like polyferredoxin
MAHICTTTTYIASLFLLPACFGIGATESTETSAVACSVDVLVLGAGMAGVKAEIAQLTMNVTLPQPQAAADLHSHGLHTLVLEQSDRLGGRMWHRLHPTPLCI